jgi:hypothetical protein
MKTRTLLAATLLALSVSTTGRAGPPSEPAEAIVCRGASAEGFSYEWGGECWCGNGCKPDLATCSAGTCTPLSANGCPDCTHSGKYGADCSGLVSKAWQVPNPHAVDACDVDRYGASDFTEDHAYWDPVSMNSLKPADAVASSSHAILVLGAKDAQGEHEVIEAKGCKYGIVRHSRTFSSDFSGARRINLTSCVCKDGDKETKDCGDCGTQKRSCEGGCLWSSWSDCEGPDPTGSEASCTVTGGLGACAAGQRLCVAGWLTCQALAPATDVCDGLDNDCDGVVDNGTPESLGEGYPCKNSCGDGKSVCVEGAVRCVTPGSACSADAGGRDAAAKDAAATDAATNPGGGGLANRDSGDSSSGCACSMNSGAKPTAQLLILLGLLAWCCRRR